MTKCWYWPKAINASGYGIIERDGRTLGVHRYTWEQQNGKIPIGLQLDHLCRVRHCFNPDHLEPVTCKENHRRGVRHVPLTHCYKGHLLTEDNILYERQGPTKNRRCRRCKNEWQQNRRRCVNIEKTVQDTPATGPA